MHYLLYFSESVEAGKMLACRRQRFAIWCAHLDHSQGWRGNDSSGSNCFGSDCKLSAERSKGDLPLHHLIIRVLQEDPWLSKYSSQLRTFFQGDCFTDCRS